MNDKGEITGTSKSIQRRLTVAETPFHSNEKVGGRTELYLVQDDRRGQAIAGGSPCGSPGRPRWHRQAAELASLEKAATWPRTRGLMAATLDSADR